LEKREGVESEAAQIERWEDEKSGSKRQSVPVVLGGRGGGGRRTKKLQPVRQGNDETGRALEEHALLP
jgi:hypothetical protein